MNRKTFIQLLASGALSLAMLCGVCAQTNSATGFSASNAPARAGGPGAFGRGFQFVPPGPPAPVPPEVLMPRPTQAEVDKMNADLKQFIASSPDKELLQKWESLVTVQVPRDNPCIRPAPGVRAQRHQAFVDREHERFRHPV
jgi:hypothetical protein